MIVGILGSIGSGKDTLGAGFEKHHFKRLSLGKLVKDVVALVFDWERYLLEGDTEESRAFREKKDEWWSKRLDREITPRKMLQEVGTDAFRKVISDEIWVACLERQASKYENVVVTDVRFWEEIQMVRRMKDSALVCVWRDKCPLIEPIDISKHESETQWIRCWKEERYKFDRIIHNNSTIEELQQEAGSIIKSIQNRVQ